MKVYFLLAIVFVAAVLAIHPIRSLATDKPCMNYTYPKPHSEGPDYWFDQIFDLGREGKSFSCGPQVRPSEVRRALEELRNGVLYHDKKDLNAVIRFPIVAHVSQSLEVNSKSEDIVIHNSTEWITFQKDHFSKLHTAMIACAYLGNVSAMSGRSPGVMIGDGTFWFQATSGDPKVRLVVVNLSPVNTDALIDSCAP